MMLLPEPGVLDQLIRERQCEMRETSRRRETPARGAMRVRIGHALIVAGASLSGERVERPARPPALSKAA
jgi:hypothetical protein